MKESSTQSGVQRSFKNLVSQYQTLYLPHRAIRDQYAHSTLPALKAVAPICGKSDRMTTHLLGCASTEKALKDEVKAMRDAKKEARGGSSSKAASNQTASSSGEPPAKRSKQQQFTVTTTQKWTPSRHAELATDLCRVFAANAWAWNAVENPETVKFLEKWIPGSNVPDRRDLSGPVLDKEVARYKAIMKTKTKDQLAMGQSDGWKNIAKTSIIASLITVKGEVGDP